MPPPAPDPAAQCLDQVALIASTRLQQAITRIAPRDAALTWKAAAVHPLQALETEYQGIVHDAVRGIGNVDRRKQVEGKALSEFFFFDAGAPRLLGVGQGEPYAGEDFPFLEDKLRAAREQLQAAALLLQPPPGAQVDGAELRQHLQAAYDVTLAARNAFLTLPGSRQWPVPPVVAAGVALTGIADAIGTVTRVDDFQKIIKLISQADASLTEAAVGLGTVQMFYVIESFYLFRLLIRYRIESPRGLSDDAIAEASGALTDIVTNGHDWLSAWLRDKIVELAARIASVDPSGNTLFFLKGGRAIRYLEGHPERGKNDWDTQIVINPELPAAAWYELFLRVSNTVLLALKDYKAELYMLLHHYAGRFAQELAEHPAPMDIDPPSPAQLFDTVFDRMEIDDLADRMEVDEPPDDVSDRKKANCKAELIDVGLPRYDTVEAREQWTQLRQHIFVAPDGIPYPGYYYYIAEYLHMIREVFAGASPSLRKAPARIERLYGILQLPGVEQLMDHDHGHAVADTMPKSLNLVMQIGDTPTRYALIVLLENFIKAYGLGQEPGFATTLDEVFAESLPNAAGLAPYSPALREAIAGAANWTAGLTTFTDAIGYCQWFSKGVEAHLEHRGAFVLSHKDDVFDPFLRDFFAKSIFKPTEELEVQAAARGSYGAWLQGDYAMSPRLADLDPPTYLSVGLYSARDEADPASILELVAPIVEQCLPNAGQFNIAPDADAIRVYWAEPQPIAPFFEPPYVYAPLAIEIRVIPPPSRPLLSYVWGLATLSLRDLIREYRREAAETEEYGRRIKLRETAGALTEIMTRAANPEPRNPAVAAMRRGAGHHLMISSASLAIGPGGAYPATYYPDLAYEVLLTDNRPALRAALTLQPRVPDPPVDRSLDLLVINQGHGGIGAFDHWSADDLSTYLVRPLLDSGVRASIIVLDFCLSSSLIDAFAPLCAAGGVIVSNVYSIAEVIMTTELWSEIKQPLEHRNLGAIQAAINARARAVSAGVTGLAHLQQVRTWTELQTTQYLQAFPADFDAVSITRYLPAIAAALQDPAAAPAQVFADLIAVRAAPNLGLNEQVVLVGMPAAIGQMTPAIVTQITGQLQNRLSAILTLPSYGLQLNPQNVAGMPLFGPHSLWRLVHENRMQLLALARGLRRCPTPFTSFDADTQELTLDTNLVGAAIAPQVAALLQQIEPNAPGEVQQIIGLLFQQQVVANLNGINNYLQ